MLKKLLFVGAVMTIVQLERKDQIDLYQAAVSTFRDVSGFCDRNPSVCDKGNKVIGKMASNAETSARMMVDLAGEKEAKTQDGIASLLDQQVRTANTDTSQDKPDLVAGEARFPAYKNQEYNEHYASQDKIIDPNAPRY